MAATHRFEVVVAPEDDALARTEPTARGRDEVPADQAAPLPDEAAQALLEWIEASKLPVTAEVVDGRLQVRSSSRDALSECQALIALHDQGLPLRFTNHA